jgi:hypothetical protein
MRITSEAKSRLVSDLGERLNLKGWTRTECARHCRLNQGHLSRIFDGKFKTFSSNVMRICIFLGLDPVRYLLDQKALDDRARIMDSAIAIWNGSSEDAERLVRLLQDIAGLRK